MQNTLSDKPEWKLVPLEPTDAMMKAADRIIGPDPRFMRATWNAMLAAAPQAQEPLDDDAICRLAEKCKLGVALRPIGLDTGLVFAVHGHYLTSELLDFSRALLAAAQEQTP